MSTVLTHLILISEPQGRSRPQSEAFHDLVRSGWASWPGATPAETTDIMLTIDALAASARDGNVVTIAQ